MAYGETTYGAGGQSQSRGVWKPPAIATAPAPPPSQGGTGSPELPSLQEMLKLQSDAEEQRLAQDLERQKQMAALARREAARNLTSGAPMGGLPQMGPALPRPGAATGFRGAQVGGGFRGGGGAPAQTTRRRGWGIDDVYGGLGAGL